MAKNKVQFQAGMSLTMFLERYGTEAQCRAAVAHARWPDGFVCSECGHTGHCQLNRRAVYQCNRCKHQVSLTSGTLFAGTHLPLRTWFLAIYLLVQHKTGLSALSLHRQLGVSYNTAWLIKHKLMQAMVERDGERTLQGIVQMDDAYWGGERHGSAMAGRGTPGKTPFVAAIECTPKGEPVRMRMDVLSGFRKTTITDWARRHLARGTAVVSDGLNCFPGVLDAGCTHVPIVTGGGVPKHPIFWWVNTMLGNVKNALHGTYHSVRPKYVQRYLSEFCYRFNRRYDLDALVARMVVAATRTPPLSYRLAIVDA